VTGPPAVYGADRDRSTRPRSTTVLLRESRRGHATFAEPGSTALAASTITPWPRARIRLPSSPPPRTPGRNLRSATRSGYGSPPGSQVVQANWTDPGSADRSTARLCRPARCPTDSTPGQASGLRQVLPAADLGSRSGHGLHPRRAGSGDDRRRSRQTIRPATRPCHHRDVHRRIGSIVGPATLANLDLGVTSSAHASNPGATEVQCGRILKGSWPAFPQANPCLILRARRDSNPNLLIRSRKVVAAGQRGDFKSISRTIVPLNNNARRRLHLPN
jgi:hypothetical protein